VSLVAEPFKGKIELDVRDSTPDWEAFTEPRAPEGAPNVLYIVWDDTGYGALETYGGLIEMPTMKRLADNGVSYRQFHTVAFCSPTRSCLLTGRHATSNGMACIEETATGFPGSSGRIPPENGTIAEVLVEQGWNTFAVGKWHLTPADEGSMASSKRTWPLGRGFDRYYGFLGGESDQYYPDLIYDNHQVDQPYSPAEGYHLSIDLADKAIEFIKDSKSLAPNKPFLMYFCPGANHAPHHAPKEWIDKYKGKFDMGYERYREIVLENQKKLGLVPEDTELPPINPYEHETSGDGKPWPANDLVRPWDSLTDDEKRLFCRFAEAYAGYSSFTDHQVGRILDFLEEIGQLDNTIVVWVSDNGASAEGGPSGTVNENNFFNSVIDTVEEQLAQIDLIGSEHTYNHYPTGWAMGFDTPFKLFKRYASHEGGTADPMLVSWPAGMKTRGEWRDQYLHAIDIVPTIYDCLGITPPDTVKGHKQEPIHGASFRASFDNADAAQPRDTQFYVMLGTRGIWHDGWLANTVHPPMTSGWGHFDADRWELYHLAKDRNQMHDLAAEQPDRLERMKKLWYEQAKLYNGLPLEDRTGPEFLKGELDFPAPTFSAGRDQQIFYPGTAEVAERVAMQYFGRSFSVLAEVEIDTPEAEGVLFAHGGRFGGHSLYLKDGKLRYTYNWLGKTEQKIVSEQPFPTGKHILGVRFETEGMDGSAPSGTATLSIDDDDVGSATIKIQPGHFSLCGEGINAGRDGGQPVTDDYESPFPFKGGKLKQVVLDRSGEPFGDMERHLEAAFSRD
jgi:arylsulfatase A-like enzyme